MAKIKWNLDTINNWAKENRPNYRILDWKIENYQNKVKLKCPNKNHSEFWMLTASFLKGNECELCGFKKISSNKIKWTDEVLKQYIKEKLNITIISIKRNRKYIELTLVDQYEYKYASRLVNIMHNKELHIVHTNNPYSIENINNWIKINKKDFILYSNEYIGNKNKMKWFCLKCNRVFYQSWDCIQRGQDCTNCIEKSKGETQVKNVLQGYNIKFIPQHTFPDCKYKQVLQFDFYLHQFNLLIEYQGKQHYEPVDFAGKGEEWAFNNFKLIQKLDQIKRDYAKNNNIKLLEIPYWEFDNIETILKNELKIKEEL